MPYLTTHQAEILTETYLSFYADHDRATEDEVAWLKTQTDTRGASYLDDLHAALLPDDALSRAELDGFESLSSATRQVLAQKFVPRLQHDWIRRFAPRVDQNWESPAFDVEAWLGTYTALMTLQRDTLPEDVATHVEWQQTLGHLVLGGIFLYTTLESVRGQDKSLRQTARELKNIPSSWLTEEQRLKIEQVTEECHNARRDLKVAERDFAKAYRAYKRTVRQFKHGRLDAEALENYLTKKNIPTP